MDRQDEIREGITKQQELRGNFADKILTRHKMTRDEALWEALAYMRFLHSQGVVIKVEGELPLISRERAESAIPDTDCSGRKFTLSEWEDLVRTIVHGAEIQRDKDKYDSGYVAVESLI